MSETKQLTVEIIRSGGIDGVYHLILEPHSKMEAVYSLSWAGMRAFANQLQSMLESPSTCHLMATYDLEQADMPPNDEEGA